MCEAVRKEGEGEVGGAEERVSGQRRAAMSRRVALAIDTKLETVAWA